MNNYFGTSNTHLWKPFFAHLAGNVPTRSDTLAPQRSVKMDEKQLLLEKERHGINSVSDVAESKIPCSPYKLTLNHQGSEKSSTGSISWKHLKLFIFPVEIVSFLFLFGMYFEMQLYQQYYFQRIFRTIIKDNVTNMSIDDICLNQSLIENITSSESFVKGQKMVNDFSMITVIIFLLPSIVVSLFAGPLSDRYGRKPLFASVFIGQLIAAVCIVLIVYLELNMLYFFIGAFAMGISGGFGVMMGATFSYISDVTPKKWLTIRMGIVEASIFVSTATSSAAAYKWIQLTNCTFKPQVWVVVAAVVLGLIYTIIIPESLSKESRVKNMSKSKKGLKSLAIGVKIFFWKSYLGINVWKLWIVLIVMVLIMINQNGITEIIAYILHNKPLEWDYELIGTYIALSSVSHLVALIFLLPILVLIKLPDSVITLIGVCVSCGMYVFAALFTKSWEMFLGEFTPPWFKFTMTAK